MDFQEITGMSSNSKRFYFLLKIAMQEESRQTKSKQEKKRRQWGWKYFSDIVGSKEAAGSSSNSKQENMIKIKRKRQSKGSVQETEKPKLKRCKKETLVCPNPQPFLPENLQQYISNKGGSDLALVIQKSLFKSDVNPQASRFAIPIAQLQTNGFLTETEAADLDDKEGIQVCLLEPSMNETFLTLNRWNMQTSSSYVLTTQWNSVVQNNKLKVGDIVQLWSFRVESTLRFVLIKVPINN